MDSSFWFDTISWVSASYISRDVRFKFKKKNPFFCLKTYFTFTNSVVPDEMQHHAAFHLGLHCLQKYLFRGFPKYKGLKNLMIHVPYIDFIIFSSQGY